MSGQQSFRHALYCLSFHLQLLAEAENLEVLSAVPTEGGSVDLVKGWVPSPVRHTPVGPAFLRTRSRRGITSRVCPSSSHTPFPVWGPDSPLNHVERLFKEFGFDGNPQ